MLGDVMTPDRAASAEMENDTHGRYDQCGQNNLTPSVLDSASTSLIGGLHLTALDRAEWVQALVSDVQIRRGRSLPPRLLSSANGNVIAQYHRDPKLRRNLDAMDAIDADGMPLVFASKWISPAPLPERVATTDFFHDAAKAAEQHGLRFYILGGTPEVNAQAMANVAKLYPNLILAGGRNGYFTEAEIPQILDEIEANDTDVLWVGMGVPREQAFLVNHAGRLRGVTWAKSCGGLLDFLAGRYQRAPEWMQSWGLEWAYRALSEPGRLGKRYATTNLTALYHILTASELRFKRR